MARPDRFTPPPGCVVIRLDDLAALLAARAPAASAAEAAPGPGTWEALSAVVAALTAGLGDDANPPGLAELAPDVPAEVTASVALAVTAGWLRALGPAAAAAVLRSLGLLAAARGEPPGGPDGDRAGRT